MRLTTFALFFAALYWQAAAQEVEMLAGPPQIVRITSPSTVGLSLVGQYDYSGTRRGKHAAALLLRHETLQMGRLRVSPEVGFGITRAAQTDVHEWVTNTIVQWQGIYIVESRMHREERVRTPWLGTGIAGVAGHLRITQKFSLVGLYQHHWINDNNRRNIAAGGIVWKW